MKNIVFWVFIASMFLSCNKDPLQGWNFMKSPPPPLQIKEISAVIRNCEPPYPVTFSQYVENQRGTVSYFWDFGDGNTSTDKYPHHIYSTPGNYTVKFIVSNEISSDTAYLSLPELANPSIPIVAQYSYTRYNNNSFAPNKIIFKNQSSGANLFYWYFGDGNESNAFEPTHVFQQAGQYTVTMRATCTNNTYQQVSQQITVNPPPQRIFVDAINLMLPSQYRNLPLFIELWHNTTFVGATVVKTTSSFPVKFQAPADFVGQRYFDYLQYSPQEVLKFIVKRYHSDIPSEPLFEFAYSSYAIQHNFYPRSIMQIELPPFDPRDVFIDLYVSY